MNYRELLEVPHKNTGGTLKKHKKQIVTQNFSEEQRYPDILMITGYPAQRTVVWLLKIVFFHNKVMERIVGLTELDAVHSV